MVGNDCSFDNSGYLNRGRDTVEHCEHESYRFPGLRKEKGEMVERKILVKRLAVLAGLWMMVPFSALNALAQPAPIPQTGITLTYCELQRADYDGYCTKSDDGELQEGVPWPSPRFDNNTDGTIKDNLTGLTWTKIPTYHPE